MKKSSLLSICKRAMIGMTLMTAGAGSVFAADMSNGADNFYKSDIKWELQVISLFLRI